MLSGAALLAAPTVASGQGIIEATIANADKFVVEVVDDVSDDCLPNPKALKNAVELKLLANGFRLHDNPSGRLAALVADRISVEVRGFAVTTGRENGDKIGCAVRLDIKLSAVTLGTVPLTYGGQRRKKIEDFVRFNLWESSKLLTTGNKSIQQIAKRQVEDDVDELILTAIKTRSTLFSRYPESKMIFENIREQ